MQVQHKFQHKYPSSVPYEHGEEERTRRAFLRANRVRRRIKRKLATKDGGNVATHAVGGAPPQDGVQEEPHLAHDDVHVNTEVGEDQPTTGGGGGCSDGAEEVQVDGVTACDHKHNRALACHVAFQSHLEWLTWSGWEYKPYH